jgi:hypothetical protein
MPKWSVEVDQAASGNFQIVMTKPGGQPVDVTYFRGAPTKIQSYSNGDPFGDAAAVLQFPQLSAFDEADSADVGSWLADFSAVDIYWKPVSGPREKIWEGYVASLDINASETDTSVSVSCQGALFQLDRYLQKPFFPPRPWPLENLIGDSFRRTFKPHLRLKAFRIDWPTGWDLVVPAYTSTDAYTPVAKPGSKYTGYTSRATGSWDHTLTGFVQDQLAVMYTTEESGVTPGNQWTVLQEMGRKPYLTVRDRFRAPDFELWMGTPGTTFQLTRDTTQMANIIYGDGTGTDGTAWRNAAISSDGAKTDYLPIAASPRVYPPVNNKEFDKSAFASEAYYSYGSGFALDMAIASAEKSLQRDQDPGYSGSMTLRIDPVGMNRYKIRAGMTVRVKGIVGSGASGMAFHIAEVEVSPDEGTVQCKIDTRYRDLLNLEQAQARTRDPLTPSKMLQVNRRSIMIEDIMAPWDYTAGSGFVPKASRRFHKNRPNNVTFPWESWAKQHPPRLNPEYYVRVNANKTHSKDRWTLGKDVPILMSEKGTIRRVEVAAFDRNGNILKIPFHFGLYYVNVTTSAMPHQGTNFSPFQTGAFESLSPTGQPWPSGNFFSPDPSMIIGWGNLEQPAGYSPGRKSDGFAATGVLVDEGTFSYDCTNNPNFNKDYKLGVKQTSPSAVTIYGAFYASYTSAVYFMARMYRQEPGT